MSSEIESIKYFVYHCRLHADGECVVKECSMASLLELNSLVKSCAMSSIFGGYGYMEYKIARMFRDSRIGTIGGGTSEIMRGIAKMVIDDKSYQNPTNTPIIKTKPTNGSMVTSTTK